MDPVSKDKMIYSALDQAMPDIQIAVLELRSLASQIRPDF